MMFAQMICMQAPDGEIKHLRKLVFDEYLPAIRERPGFISAHLLEQVDDRDTANLLIFWDSQQSVEDEKTGVLAGSTHSIAARMPGLRVTRQSYIVDRSIDKDATEQNVQTLA